MIINYSSIAIQVDLCLPLVPSAHVTDHVMDESHILDFWRPYLGERFVWDKLSQRRWCCMRFWKSRTLEDDWLKSGHVTSASFISAHQALSTNGRPRTNPTNKIQVNVIPASCCTCDVIMWRPVLCLRHYFTYEWLPKRTNLFYPFRDHKVSPMFFL